MNGEAVCRRLSGMRSARSLHEGRWRDCFDLTWPERSDYFWQSSDTSTGAQGKRAEIVDSTCSDGAEMLASGIVGGMVPSNMQWFDLDTGDPNRVEQNDWLSETGRFLWNAIHASNFDSLAVDLFADLVAAGWCVLFCAEHEHGGLEFQWWPLGQCYISASRDNGPVDTVFREYSLTVEQAVNKFGYDQVSPRVRSQFDKGGEALSEKVEFVMAIMPRDKRDPRSPYPRDMAIAAYDVEVSTKHLVREGGYHEFPCAVPRWRMIPGSQYAVGPVSRALPDAKSLNDLGLDELQASKLDIGGMWKARDDGVLNPSMVKLGPRKIVTVADMDNFQRLDTGLRGGQRAWSTKEQMQAQIRRTLRSDYLQPQDKPQMTAYEVHVRVQMIRQLLGPDFGRFQSEFLQPLIQRVMGLAMRAGVLPPMPEGLEWYSIQFKSPMAQAQRAEDAEATAGYIDWVTNLATAKQDASVFDGIDLDKAGRHIATGRGVPTDVLRDPDEVLEIRKAREQAAQQQEQDQQQQQMQMMAAEGAAKRVAAGA